jgi:peptidoglycan LD-endopeptidase LytH
MKLVIIIFLSISLLSCSRNNYSGASGEEMTTQDILDKTDYESIVAQFYVPFIQYRLGFISKEAAAEYLSILIGKINDYYIDRNGKLYTFDEWVFPLKGYGPEHIGGTNGSGFVTDGSDLFEEGGLKGHPAHDIFIYDNDQDEIDDRTNMPVEVLSMTGGVVISTRSEWSESDSSKGGKNIWIFDPVEKAIFYYAHNRRIFVSEGDVVKPGDVIAEVGRTGENAYESRSPTHLHLGSFKIENGIPKPYDYYSYLIKAKQM